MQPVQPNPYPQPGAYGAAPVAAPAAPPPPHGPIPTATTFPYTHPITVREEVAAPKLGEKYNATSGKQTGWVQFASAIISMGLGIVQLVLGSELAVIGYGIWGGLLFFLPTGILGICSGSKNACTIVAYMVMSIISAMMAFVILILASITAGIDGDEYSCYYDDNCDSSTVRVVVSCILVFVALMEFITAIVASAYCCAGVCCGRTEAQPTISHVIHYYPNTVGPISVAPGGFDGRPPMAAPYPYGGAHGINQPPIAPPPQNSDHASPPPTYDMATESSNKPAIDT